MQPSISLTICSTVKTIEVRSLSGITTREQPHRHRALPRTSEVIIRFAASLPNLNTLKFQIAAIINYTKDGDVENIIPETFITVNFKRPNIQTFITQLDKELAKFQQHVEEVQMRGSNFVFLNFAKIELIFHRTINHRGNKWFKLDSPFYDMKCLINPKNKDNYCFMWAVLAALHHEDIPRDRTHTSKYVKFWDQYYWSMFNEDEAVEIDVRTLSKFEEANNTFPFS